MKIMVLAAAALVATTLSAAAEHEDLHVGLLGTAQWPGASAARHRGSCGGRGGHGYHRRYGS